MNRHCDRAIRERQLDHDVSGGHAFLDRRMRAFKPGAFRIAARNRVPIQPILIRGTSEALPKRGFILQGRHPISIEILDPIPVEEVVGCEPEEMMLRVRKIIEEGLARDAPPA